MKKKYKLLKDTPYDEAGTELFDYGENYGYASLNSYVVDGKSYPAEVVENTPEWFAANEGTECEHEAKGQDCGCREPKKIEKLKTEYREGIPGAFDMPNSIDLINKMNEIIDQLNKE